MIGDTTVTTVQYSCQTKKLDLSQIIYGSQMTRVTENSVSTIKFYRVFLKIYERISEDI